MPDKTVKLIVEGGEPAVFKAKDVRIEVGEKDDPNFRFYYLDLLIDSWGNKQQERKAFKEKNKPGPAGRA